MINAQALIGTVLGNCTIQKLVGQGSMGAVFLAQQTHPQRQVAIKVLSPATVQTQGQRTQFLERFRQEIKAISSLEHQHIVSIYTYDVYEGFAYLTMPYISGGTLHDVLEQQQPLALPVIASYLDQLASALDYAHEHGVIHRDVRPTNILKTPEGRLLLTDFGLVKIAIERHSSQMSLLKSGIPIGSLEYMAPEQIMGDVIDARTDLYSLGVILYQMVTGKTPFQGGTPVQVATQLVQASPPPPRLFRTDLPTAAEQVILQALAKRSQDRYARCQDFANAFRVALTAAGLLQESSPTALSTEQSNSSFITRTRKRGLFDPMWQKTQPTSQELPPTPVLAYNTTTNNETSSDSIPSTSTASMTSITPATFAMQNEPVTPVPPVSASLSIENIQHQNHGQATPIMPTTTTTSTPSPAPTRMRTGLRASLLHSVTETPAPIPPVAPAVPIAQAALTPPPPEVPNQPSSPRQFGNVTRALPASNSEQGTTGALPVPNPVSPFPATNTTGALMVPGTGQGTVKLTGAMKVVQVPVAGQPGRYVTGLLPVLPQTQLPPPPLSPASPHETPKSRLSQLSKLSHKQKILALALVIALICFIPGILLFTRLHPSQIDKGNLHGEVFTPNWSAIYAAQATATANANDILTDPLSQNIHNWPIADSGYQVYKFENGAYHVLDNDVNQSAPAILPGVTASSPMVYTLTMEEVKGNDGSVNNSFGMIFRFTSQTQGNQNAITFYSFEVVNTHGGEYQFWKYDNSKGKSAHPWTSIWHHPFGGEFHQGQGSKNSNTFKVIANGKNFTFVVNDKTVGTTQDASLTSGEIGMLVNLKGTEVAFSNLLLTYN